MVVSGRVAMSGVAQWLCCVAALSHRAQVRMLRCCVHVSTCHAQVEL